MATYFVRKSGSDGNAGTSAATAFLTIGKVIHTGGVGVAGDTVYVGAGIYREQITLGPSPAGNAISVIGDVDGAQTGDPGEVRLTAYLVTDVGNGNASAINMNGKNWFTFSNMVIQSLGSNACVINAGGNNWAFTDCAFFYIGGGGAITGTLAVDTNSNVLIDRCYGYGFNSSPISITLPTSAVADYNCGVTIRNFQAVHASATASFLVDVASSGAQAFFGGGILVRHCTVYGMGLMRTTGVNLSTSIPCDIRGSLCHIAATAIISGAAGQITEDWNVLVCNTARTNVTAGTHTVAGTNIGFMPSVGHERIWGGEIVPFGHLHVLGSPIDAWGSDAAPTVDLNNRPRPSGQARRVASGTLTSATATTAVDSGATWGTNALNGAVIKITGGTGAGQVKLIKSHTPTAITTFGNWVTTPDSLSTYEIYYGAVADIFKVTANTNTTNATATLASGSWTTNQWAGFTASVTSGTGAGQTLPIASNTATVLTFVGVWGTPLDAVTSVITIFRQTSENAINVSAGAQERHNRARKETALVDSGVCYALDGWCDQDYFVPVDAGVSVTFTVKTSWTTDHGNTNKPRLEVVANGEIGVSGASTTATGTAGSGTFETLTLTFTPTAKGVANLRFRSRADKINGYASFDTVNVS